MAGKMRIVRHPLTYRIIERSRQSARTELPAIMSGSRGVSSLLQGFWTLPKIARSEKYSIILLLGYVEIASLGLIKNISSGSEDISRFPHCLV